MKQHTLLMRCLLAGTLVASGQPMAASLLLTGKARSDAAVKAF